MSSISDFKITNGKLTKYIGADVDITIPDSVTEIGSKAFYECRDLKSVSIPDSVKKIGSEAFESCSNLTTINIPKEVNNLNMYVFAFCSSLKTINIPNGVKKIGEGAFSSCRSLESIIIPDSVKTIEGHAFQGCKSLTFIDVPGSVSQIGDYAFQGCKAIKTLKIASIVMLKEMEKMRYDYTSGIFAREETLKLEYLVSSFYNSKLAEFAAKDGVRFVFKGNLKDIKDKDIKVKAITEILQNNPDAPEPDKEELKYINAFIKKNAELFDHDVIKAYVSGDVELNDSIIGVKGNENKTAKKVTVGQLKRLWKIKDIDETSVEIFGYKGSDEIVEIPAKVGKKEVVKIRKSAQWNEVFGYMKEVTIPYGVREIDDNTFSYCKNLTNVNLPDSLERIGCWAFMNCNNLADIFIPDSVVEIDLHALSCSTDLTIHAHAGSCAEKYAKDNNIKFELV